MTVGQCPGPGAHARQVIAFGNPLHGDDGFGPAVLARLAAMALPAGVHLHDAGTRGPDALALFDDGVATIVVDVFAPGEAPGRIVEVDAAAVAGEATGACTTTPGGVAGGAATAGGASRSGSGALLHRSGVGTLLAELAALGLPLPRVIGAEGVCIAAFAPGLSPPVAAAVAPVAERVRTLLERHDG